MSEYYEPRKHTDKIVLPGLLILSLLLARLIVASRLYVTLSSPIKVESRELSVSMPTGKGWYNGKKWNPLKNAMTLGSVFTPGTGGTTAMARCQYLLAPTITDAPERFMEKASAIGGVIEQTSKIRAGIFVVDCVHIKREQILLDIFFGTVRLPNNRQLDIEVHQTTGDAELAERIFKRIIESLEFKDVPPFSAGTEVVEKIKRQGLATIIADGLAHSRENLFLIKDATGHIIGFTMGVLLDSDRSGQFNIQAADYSYIHVPFSWENASSFQSNNHLDQFTWKGETGAPDEKIGSETILDKSGILTVRELGSRPSEKKYRFGPAAIPAVFTELVLHQMLEGNYEQILVDIIEAEGRIVPVLFSRIETGKPPPKTDIAHAFILEMLDGRGFYAQVLLDSQRKTSKVLLHQEALYILERATREDIIKQFPEQAEYVLRQSSTLK